LAPTSRRNFTLTNVCGVPNTARAISVNVTVTAPTALGFIALFPGNGIPSQTSTVNFSAGQTRGNNALASLATDGTGSIAVLNGAAGTVHLIIDVTGYFQ
jgi:hypothetical protein